MIKYAGKIVDGPGVEIARVTLVLAFVEEDVDVTDDDEEEDENAVDMKDVGDADDEESGIKDDMVDDDTEDVDGSEDDNEDDTNDGTEDDTVDCIDEREEEEDDNIDVDDKDDDDEVSRGFELVDVVDVLDELLIDVNSWVIWIWDVLRRYECVSEVKSSDNSDSVVGLLEEEASVISGSIDVKDSENIFKKNIYTLLICIKNIT